MKQNHLKLSGKIVPINADWENSVHIATRTTLFCTIALYQVGDFYVEVFFNPKNNEVARIRTFDSTEQLAPYLNKINIKGLFS